MAVSDRALCAGEVTLDRAGMRLREGVVLCPLAAALPDCVDTGRDRDAKHLLSKPAAVAAASATPLAVGTFFSLWRTRALRPWRTSRTRTS